MKQKHKPIKRIFIIYDLIHFRPVLDSIPATARKQCLQVFMNPKGARGSEMFKTIRGKISKSPDVIFCGRQPVLAPERNQEGRGHFYQRGKIKRTPISLYSGSIAKQSDLTFLLFRSISPFAVDPKCLFRCFIIFLENFLYLWSPLY